MRILLLSTLLLGGTACMAYRGGYEATLFLSGRLIDDGGDPLNHCQAGVEFDGVVDDWRQVDTNMREVFLVSTLAGQQVVVIQCAGYESVRVTATPLPGGRWRVGDEEYRTNADIPLGEIRFNPRT